MVYLDHNATTPLLPEACDAMLPFMLHHWGNASSPHAFADEPRKAVAEARASVAELIGARPSEVVFTSGATESNQAVLDSFLGQGKSVIGSSVEHSSILTMLRSPGLASPAPLVPVSAQGAIDLQELQRILEDSCPALISAIWVNNETGIISPVEDVVEQSHRAGAMVHLDAAQAAGKIPVDVENVRADYVSLSAHKVHGPKGIGALFVREGAEFRPLLHGAQERGRRGGTEAVPLIVGFGMAARAAREKLEERQTTTLRLRDSFESRLLASFPEAVVNGRGAPRVTNTSSVTFPGTDGEILVALLSQRGVYVSNGSACKASSPTPSHVLLAMGRSYEDSGATVRFSFSSLNTNEDIDTALAALSEVVPLVSDRG